LLSGEKDKNMFLTMLIVGIVVAIFCPPIGCLIVAVDAYMVAAAYPIIVGILCGVAYLALCVWLIYS